MRNFKFILGIIAIVGIAVFSVARYNVVFADDQQGSSLDSVSQNIGGNEGENKGNSDANASAFAIGSGGEVTLNGGTLSSVTDQTATISVFGLTVKAMVTPTTQLIGMGTSTLAALKTGDVIDVRGTIDASSGLITATTFKDRTFQTQNVANIQAQIQSLLALLRQLQAQVQGGQGGQIQSGHGGDN